MAGKFTRLCRTPQRLQKANKKVSFVTRFDLTAGLRCALVTTTTKQRSWEAWKITQRLKSYCKNLQALAITY
jgi:hypothetical protein